MLVRMYDSTHVIVY